MSKSKVFQNANFTIQCPNCEHDIEINVKQIGSSIICDSCKTPIDLIDDGFTKSVHEADKEIDNFYKSLDKIFK